MSARVVVESHVSARVALPEPAAARATGVRISPALVVEVFVLAAVLWLAVSVRLTGLADHTDVSDEGIRGVQLRLLQAGFRPVSEIYASQGPLSLWLFYPSVALFGADIVVARLTVVAYSLMALAGSVWIARRIAGPVAGVGAGAVLAISPVFLDNSRLAFVEVPSLAPTILGLVALVLFRQSERRGWLIAAAALMAVGALAKPMAAVAGLPAAIVMLAPHLGGTTPKSEPARRWRARFSDLGLFTLIGAIVCAVVIAAAGPSALYDQLVTYRLGARAVRGWDLWTNATLIVGQLRLHGWGVLLAAALGVAFATVRGGWLGAAVVVWLVGALSALLAYSPLWDKHLSYIAPPLAILAGVGIAPLGTAFWPRMTWPSAAIAAPALVAMLLVVTHLPTLASDTRAIVYRHAGSDLSRYADDVELVKAITAPDDFVVVDDAYLGMLTGRLTPPFLADLSWNRILARALTAEQAIAATREYESTVLILQDDHLGQVQRYLAWADREYVLVKSYVQRRPARFRRVYVSPSANLDAARRTMLGTLATQTDVRFGPAALLGYEVSPREIKPGSRLDLTLMFEALQNRPPEHALIIRLRDRSGETAWEGEWKVGDGGQELHTWSHGRWQAQTIRLLVDDIDEGSYTLTMALQRPNGNPARVDARSGARARPGGDELDLGEVQVAR